MQAVDTQAGHERLLFRMGPNQPHGIGQGRAPVHSREHTPKRASSFLAVSEVRRSLAVTPPSSPPPHPAPGSALEKRPKVKTPNPAWLSESLRTRHLPRRFLSLSEFSPKTWESHMCPKGPAPPVS